MLCTTKPGPRARVRTKVGHQLRRSERESESFLPAPYYILTYYQRGEEEEGWCLELEKMPPGLGMRTERDGLEKASEIETPWKRHSRSPIAFFSYPQMVSGLIDLKHCKKKWWTRSGDFDTTSNTWPRGRIEAEDKMLLRQGSANGNLSHHLSGHNGTISCFAMKVFRVATITRSWKKSPIQWDLSLFRFSPVRTMSIYCHSFAFMITKVAL